MSVHEGIATLTDDVDTWAQRAEAMRVAIHTAGIWSMRNRLIVRGFAYPWNAGDEEFFFFGPYSWRD
jgi:hypothetical protein